MIHDRRGKASKGLVTGIALPGVRNVVNRLAERIRAVVAGRTATSHGRARRGVIKDTGCPGRRRAMAGIALCRRADVSCRLGLGVLRQIAATMTARALAGHPSMVHHSRRPIHKPQRVTGVTGDGGRNMAPGTTECIGKDIAAIVTIGALTSRAAVIHLGWLEGDLIGVTCIASRRSRNVIKRLAYGIGTVMAA